MSTALPKVLKQIDADLDQSLNRLLICSAFPRYRRNHAGRPIARVLRIAAADLASLGFEASVRPTPATLLLMGHAKADKSKPHVPLLRPL